MTTSPTLRHPPCRASSRQWRMGPTQTKRASMINGLLSVSNDKHKIYEVASGMATFFEWHNTTNTMTP